jgi:N6-adenosine-specific RNA methylase IME4
MSNKARLKNHRFADLFPMMVGDAFDELVADIRECGVRENIVLYDGKILDGRNRYLAAIEAGFDPDGIPTEDFWGDNDLAAIDFVMSRNQHRRQMDDTQKAMVAFAYAIERAKVIAEMEQPGEITAPLHNAIEEEPAGRSHDNPVIAAAAKVWGTNPTGVKQARTVNEHGTRALIDRAKQGGAPISTFAAIAKLPPEQQDRIAALPTNEMGYAIKGERRAERIGKLAEKTEIASAKLGQQQYPVLLVDPPWAYKSYSEVTGSDRSASNHYPVMEIAEISALKLPAMDDAALFLWMRAEMVEAAMAAIRAWGFEYKTQIVWVKPSIGLGKWVRNRHEVLWICTRGHFPAPEPGTQSASVIEAPRGKHSEKPDEFRDAIVKMTPGMRRLEMFSRSLHPDFDAWGNEAPADRNESEALASVSC